MFSSGPPPCTFIPENPAFDSDTPGRIWRAFIRSGSPKMAGVRDIVVPLSVLMPLLAVSRGWFSGCDTTSRVGSVAIFTESERWSLAAVTFWGALSLLGCFSFFLFSTTFFPFILYSISVPRNISSSTLLSGFYLASTVIRISFKSSEEYTKLRSV